MLPFSNETTIISTTNAVLFNFKLTICFPSIVSRITLVVYKEILKNSLVTKSGELVRFECEKWRKFLFHRQLFQNAAIFESWPGEKYLTLFVADGSNDRLSGFRGP